MFLAFIYHSEHNKIMKQGQSDVVRILIIEDDVDILTMIETILTDEGHAVLTSYGDQPVLPLVQAYAPDLIILDLGLPVLPGEAILDELWTNETTRALPVILSSAWHAQMTELQHLGRQRGQPVFTLPKPYGLHQLFSTLEQAADAKT